MADQRSDTDVVRRGGVAKDDVETEDVTRDTYGFPASSTRSSRRDRRLKEAEHQAEQSGIPGVMLPDENSPRTPHEP
jgi:hypothetical protein